MLRKSNKDPFSRALGYAYRLLSVRGRSENELKARMKEKGYGRERIDEIILYLKDKGFIDDSKFARAWIEDRSQFKPKGVMALRDELFRKGLDRATIDGAIEDAGIDESKAARALAEEKCASFKGADAIKRKRSVYNHLARRGFSFSVINDIINTL
ncbi:MAG: regulatory protein RecX [Candidatus Omnitrophica bacterium]|nr:regulatory protein RecX [Candidatus Omnitrophota bacterium]